LKGNLGKKNKKTSAEDYVLWFCVHFPPEMEFVHVFKKKKKNQLKRDKKNCNFSSRAKQKSKKFHVSKF